MHAVQRTRQLSQMRMRRVVVKVHIARANGGIGVRTYGRHLDYIQRDGVDRGGEGGELYGRDSEIGDGRSFLERSRDDRHQFRIIVSPEDTHALSDMKASTRALMRQMERDLGTRLDWVAVDHHNTGHSHTHIIVRGKDAQGADLVIARDYLTKGLRARAEEGLTQELGPRRDVEIAKARYREVSQDRFTNLDRELAKLSVEEHVELPAMAGSGGRFMRSLYQQRLSYLETLHLAQPSGTGRWRLKEGWDRALKAMGRRGDIVRGLAAGLAAGETTRGMCLFEERPVDASPLTGVVISQGPDDELRDTRFLLVEDTEGTRWAVSSRGIEPGGLPPRGAVIEVSAALRQARASDRVIANIAERNGGYYSDDRHAVADPSSSRNFREAHKRRLEALRRAGLVTRQADGVWEIDEGYLKRAAEFEASKGGGVKIQVRSWMALETQIEARAETWLDQVGNVEIGDGETRLQRVRRLRLGFLRREGLLQDGQDQLSDEVRQRLRVDELRRAAVAEMSRSGRAYSTLETGERFEGVFERTNDLAQGRMAIIGNEKAFAIVPWRPNLERQRGWSLVIEASERGIGWTLPGWRQRGLGR